MALCVVTQSMDLSGGSAKFQFAQWMVSGLTGLPGLTAPRPVEVDTTSKPEYAIV